MALLVVMALLIDPSSASIRAWFVIALVFSLAGDIFLILNRDLFVVGLGSFLVAHIAYIVGLGLSGIRVTVALIALWGAVIAVLVIGRRIQRSAARADRRLAGPVAVYIAVISVMFVSAAGAANLFAFVGATLFYASDAILGWDRFVSPITNGRLLTMMTYHGAQALLVSALVTL
jgi:uncharacterized membrane protein YhhN